MSYNKIKEETAKELAKISSIGAMDLSHNRGEGEETIGEITFASTDNPIIEIAEIHEVNNTKDDDVKLVESPFHTDLEL